MLTTIPFEKLTISGQNGFLIVSPLKTPHWLIYAPTLTDLLPNVEEKWLFEKCLAAGISIAGIDVGESYGNVAGQSLYTDLYDNMVTRGFSPKVILYGRSRGGLMILSWAVNHPECVAGIAGLYPVFNLVSYPGLYASASAYNMTPHQLNEKLAEYNPVERVDVLKGIPFFSVSGDSDRIVPFELNTGRVKDKINVECIVMENQGHSMWRGFFECQDLVDFLLRLIA
jgi:pimeloyl-ACP methyl ester carboxylesterase